MYLSIWAFRCFCFSFSSVRIHFVIVVAVRRNHQTLGYYEQILASDLFQIKQKVLQISYWECYNSLQVLVEFTVAVTVDSSVLRLSAELE